MEAKEWGREFFVFIPLPNQFRGLGFRFNLVSVDFPGRLLEWPPPRHLGGYSTTAAAPIERALAG